MIILILQITPLLRKETCLTKKFHMRMNNDRIIIKYNTSHNIYIDKQIQLIQNLDKSKLSKLKILPKNVVDQTKTAKKCWLPV